MVRLGFEDKMADDVKRYSLDSWFNANMAAGIYKCTHAHNCAKWPADNDFCSHSNIYIYVYVVFVQKLYMYMYIHDIVLVYTCTCIKSGLLRPAIPNSRAAASANVHCALNLLRTSTCT